ncbi:MAG: hypothetical protein U9N53_08055, partial [Bacteroidota bacterium]|nr:hypothetical protein [Bacteroidota bacterium]
NFFGDYNWRHNISGSPILFWPVGIFFLIGFILCIKNALKHLIQTIQKKIASQVPSSKFQVPSFMILWFFVMLLPGFLSSEGTPHCLRCIGAIPVVFIFAGIGAEFLYSRLKKFLPNQNIDVWRHSDRAPFANGAREESRQRRNSTGFFAPLRMTANAKILKLFIIFAGTLLMISFTYAQYHRYFILWGQNTETQRAFSCNCVAIGNYLNTLPDNAEKYVIINESGPHIPLPIETIKFIRATKGETRLGPAPCEGPDYGVANQNTNYIFLEQIKDIEITDKQAYIILMDKNQNLLNEIQTIFPEGKIIKTSEVWGYDL